MLGDLPGARRDPRAKWHRNNQVRDASYGSSSESDGEAEGAPGEPWGVARLLYAGLGILALGLVVYFVGTGDKVFNASYDLSSELEGEAEGAPGKPWGVARLLYVGFGILALSLVVYFVGTGDKGFKTPALRLVGPSLIFAGLACCLLRIAFCIFAKPCCRRRTNYKENRRLSGCGEGEELPLAGGGAGGSELARLSVPPRAGSTRPPAMCPVCPAGRKTRDSGGTAQRRRPRTSPCHRPRCHRTQPSRARPQRPRRRSRAQRSSRARPSRARCRAPPPAARRRATSPSPAAPTENSSSARHNSAPNPQAINRRNTPFIRHRTIEPKSPHVIA